MYMLHLNSNLVRQKLGFQERDTNPMMAIGENTLNQSTEMNMI